MWNSKRSTKLSLILTDIIFAAAALLTLRLLLKNILKSEVFVSQNVKFLRILSWCCVAVALIALASGYFYLPFYIVGTAAGFFALILRVIKNVFCAAAPAHKHFYGGNCSAFYYNDTVYVYKKVSRRKMRNLLLCRNRSYYRFLRC